MVFMNGDNNLEPWAIRNFYQMAEVSDSDRVNFIVQFDRKGTYAVTDPNWSRTLRFQIRKGTRPLPQDAVEDLGKKLNMGDREVLRDFIHWTKVRYPAKKYILVIWDHGQGWRFFNTIRLSDYLAQNIAFKSQIDYGRSRETSRN